jgi:predicted nucleotidyltransferase component of viral defense system
MGGYLESLDLSINFGKLEDYKLERLQVMAQILYRINKSVNSANYVLKGGTGLLLCHGLDRFSEDIDLDGMRKVGLEKEIKAACNDLDKYCHINETKNTSTVLRYMVNYHSIRAQLYPLKIEISFREKTPLLNKVRVIEEINGIRVYSLHDLMNMKLVAFLNRDKVRDFYDLYWCVKNKPNMVSKDMAVQLLEALYYKGVDELMEVMKEEALEDHILNDIDSESIMLDFMDRVQKLLNA